MLKKVLKNIKKKNKKYEENHEEIMPSCIMLLKMTACRRNFDETKYMGFFLIKDNEMPEKYNEIWGKVSKDIKKDLILSLYTIKNI